MTYSRLQPEAKLRTRVRKDLLALQNTWFAKIQQVGIVGTPDILACINGWFVALELKKNDKEKPTRIQAHNLRKIEKSGGYSFVVSPENWPDVLQELELLAKD